MGHENNVITDIKVDPEFQNPYVDIDEWREGSVRFHYIHGGFKGQLTKVEWNFVGETKEFSQGEFTNSLNDKNVTFVKADHIFSRPGTYFPVLRVQSNREGDVNNIFTQVQNIGRVRVIVE